MVEGLHGSIFQTEDGKFWERDIQWRRQLTCCTHVRQITVLFPLHVHEVTCPLYASNTRENEGERGKNIGGDVGGRHAHVPGTLPQLGRMVRILVPRCCLSQCCVGLCAAWASVKQPEPGRAPGQESRLPTKGTRTVRRRQRAKLPERRHVKVKICFVRHKQVCRANQSPLKSWRAQIQLGPLVNPLRPTRTRSLGWRVWDRVRATEQLLRDWGAQLPAQWLAPVGGQWRLPDPQSPTP